VFRALRRLRERRILRRRALPERLWHDASAALPFLRIYDANELARLRDLVVLFLDAKSIVGARDHEVTALQRAIIGIQACVLVLNLELSLYDGFENVVVYPGEFVPVGEFEDEYGVVHERDDALAGEAMHGGPVILSWPDVEASADWEVARMNLVIHEFAHKIDMADGDANGCPPLRDDAARDAWHRAMTRAYDDFVQRVDRGEDTEIDPYAAEAPAEFFAVLSEVFFAEPSLLLDEYPDVYAAFATFYRQDPAARR
jgi:Mlc titration factor MtfA (ptsG expression regulator)